MKRNGKIHGIDFKIYVQHEYIGDMHGLDIMNGNITIRSHLLILHNGLANNEQNISRLILILIKYMLMLSALSNVNIFDEMLI